MTSPTQSPGMSELREAAKEVAALVSPHIVGAKKVPARVITLRRLSSSVPTLLDDLAAAQARADRMEGALRELLDHPDCVARLSDLDRGIGTKTREAVFLRARSALTLKSEKESAE
jgi:hypothetical protein